ncbi:MAG: hypothetical protein LC775_04730, partial [Acidobacteria bacterium]|nr:hypothetical protein [Acidobacteriota bacterium]
ATAAEELRRHAGGSGVRMLKPVFCSVTPHHPAFYESQIAKGKSHHAAVRALAYKWIRIIYRCWQTRKAYNEVTYLESLRRKGSSLLTYAAQNRA